MQEQCAALHLWLQRVNGVPDDLPSNLADHLASCPRCRGALLLFVAAHDTTALPTHRHVCAATEAQLPMLVDYERAYGAAAAVKQFPAVWWPSMVCPRCAAAYQAIQEAAAVPGEPWQPTMPAPLARRRTQIVIRGGAVTRMLGARQQLGVAWGTPHADLMISEEEQDEYRIQIFLRRKQAGRLTLVVRTEPPARGVASLMIAHQAHYLALDPDGSAVFANLAEELFDADNHLIVALDTFG